MPKQEKLVFYFNYDRNLPGYADQFQAVVDGVIAVQSNDDSADVNSVLEPVEDAIEEIEKQVPDDDLYELPTNQREEYLPAIRYGAGLHVLHDLLEMDYTVTTDLDKAIPQDQLAKIKQYSSEQNPNSDGEETKPALFDNYEEVSQKIAKNEGERYVLLVTPPHSLDAFDDDVDIKEFKERERKILKREQLEQFRKSSVQEFIEEMENPRSRGNGSISDLITDGDELYTELDQIAELDRDEITERLDNIVQPYLQPIPKADNEEDDDSIDESQFTLSQFTGETESEEAAEETVDQENQWNVIDPKQSHDEYTNLRLQDIWRYFRYSWLTPYNTVPGRNINFLVRNGALPNDPVMGIASLGSPMMNFGTRDDHIGWTEDGLAERLTRKHRVHEIEQQLPKDERTSKKKTETVTNIEWLETEEEHQERRARICENTKQAVESVLIEAIKDVRFDDFIDDYDEILVDRHDLEEEHFLEPTEDDYDNTRTALKKLEGVARYIIASNTDEEKTHTDETLAKFSDTDGQRVKDRDNSRDQGTEESDDGESSDEQETPERIIEEYGLENINFEAISIKDQNPEKLESWQERSETALFVRKRAEALQSLVRARLHYLEFYRENEDATADEFVAAALSANKEYQEFGGILRDELRGEDYQELNRTLRTALREIKKRRSGACMMNIMVCGAIPPYNEILGGKLVAMALTGPKAIESYKEIYGNQVSEIASAMKGEEVQKPTELVFLDTTGLFERGSAQYDRIRIPTENGEIEYEEIGTTEGVGTVQFGSRTRRWLSNVTRIEEDRRVVRGRFGEGVSPRLRKIRQGLTKCGLSGDLLQHKSARVIYSVDLAENARPFLRAEEDDPQYYWNFDEIETEQQHIYDYWKYRWVSKRVQKDWVLDDIQEFDLDGFLLSKHFDEGYNQTLF